MIFILLWLHTTRSHVTYWKCNIQYEPCRLWVCGTVYKYNTEGTLMICIPKLIFRCSNHSVRSQVEKREAIVLCMIYYCKFAHVNGHWKVYDYECSRFYDWSLKTYITVSMKFFTYRRKIMMPICITITFMYLWNIWCTGRPQNNMILIVIINSLINVLNFLHNVYLIVCIFKIKSDIKLKHIFYTCASDRL